MKLDSDVLKLGLHFMPRSIETFAGTNDLYFAYEHGRGVAENEGPTVHYNYQLLQAMPAGFRNFMMYQACILNYRSDQGLRKPINKTDYTSYEITADCSAVIRLRDENRFTPDDLRSVEILLNTEDRERHDGPDTEKAQRRKRNIAQCYYRNMPTEGTKPAAKSSQNPPNTP
ncbi:hypothetical protein [Bradyrhizobium sp. 1(2017)]|uniref:hypothetical protein n=1 Tax=Bradyrhizobium sp. 1(2017) TaxID=1404888 RepID=UPI00140EBB03|nr:hypothetical protein [Bradyrhizobium sp. 1(2017)]QIO32368.1 hypothetical protein HAP40_11285 [Bradyrhizobium sp. 1(2017)]